MLSVAHSDITSETRASSFESQGPGETNVGVRCSDGVQVQHHASSFLLMDTSSPIPSGPSIPSALLKSATRRQRMATPPHLMHESGMLTRS